MTRVSGVGAATVNRTASSPAGKAAPPDFAIARPSAASVGSIGGVTLTGLIALQEDACPQHRDRTARRGGERVLGALGTVQAATLAGDGNAALAALNDAVAAMTDPADPALRTIIGAIRLRARVELARADRS